jgi:hypothetical protein
MADEKEKEEKDGTVLGILPTHHSEDAHDRYGIFPTNSPPQKTETVAGILPTDKPTEEKDDSK